MDRHKPLPRDFRRLSKAELLEKLRTLQLRLTDRHGAHDGELQLLLHELEVYQIELEMQNRELRESQEELEESRDRYVNLFDFAPIGYVTLTGSGIIEEINMTGASLFGVERLWLTSRPMSPWIAPADLPKFREHLKNCRDGNQAVQSEVSINSRDRGLVPVELRSVPALTINGGATSYRTAITDLSERKQSEKERSELMAREQKARAEAERANRAKDEFLAVVSHELRTPLQPILSWVHLLQIRDLPKEDQRKGLQVIDHSARTQAQIINDLLDISRVISGKLSLNLKRIDLRQAIEKALDSCRFQAESAGIGITVSIADTPIWVLGDLSRLQQVLWNLLTNAIKFSAKGAHVEIATDRQGDYARIIVRDFGRGIAPDFLPHIFERFRQADSSITRNRGGLGLGLAIARYLIEQHGGRIFAVSEGIGKGSVFTVKIPIAFGRAPEEENAEHGEPPQKRHQSALKGLRVLVVEDDDSTRESLRELLEVFQAEVISCSSTQNALEQLEKKKPDVLLSDISMPNEDGYSLIARIRQLAPAQGGRIPAAALTAFVSPADVERALISGFQVHIAKPVDPDSLIAAVAKLVRRS